MVKQIIKEAMDRNPLGLKEAVEEELRARVIAALEEARKKMAEEDEDMDDEEDEDMDDEDDDDEDEDMDDEDDDEEDMKKESVEQIDELKKSTLASYVSKAADNAAIHGMKYGEKKAHSDEMDRMMNRHMSYSDKDQVRKIMKTTSDDVDAPRRKAAKRLKGIDLAVKKLSKD